LFVLAIDPLIRNIYANNRIVGHAINNDIIKVLSYADDVAAIVKDNQSAQEIFNEYERLYKMSGLKLNGSKTERLPLREPVETKFSVN